MKKRVGETFLLIVLSFTFIFTVTVNPALVFAEEQTSSVEISSVKGWDTNPQTNESKLWINEANFPDPIFRLYILNNFDKDKNGYIGYPEILEYQKIFISNEPELSSLQGIEYFQNLRSLDCSQTKITSIPADRFEFLERLDCYDTGLTSIDISQCTRLNYLDCSHTAITAIDVSNCSQLTFLCVISTNISALDVSSLKSLQYLQCSATKISSLDVSKNTNLLILYCSKTNISSLDLSHQPNLIDLNIDETKISNLDLSQNTKLQTLRCGRCQLRELNLENHTAFTDLFCAQTPILCINLPDSFSGQLKVNYDLLDTLYLASPANTLDLRQYAPSIQAAKISNVIGASINGTVLSNFAIGHIVSYTYQCGGETITCQFIPNYEEKPTYTILPDNCTLSGTDAAAVISNQSIGKILVGIDVNQATHGILQLETDSGRAATTTVTLPANLLSLLAGHLTGGMQVQTDHGTYLLSSAQLTAIKKVSNASDTVDVTFSKSNMDTDQIYIKGSRKEGYLVETSITASPDGTSVATSPTNSATLRAGVENTTIKASSSVGKGYIKLNWKKSSGYKVDYYEVFRSTKKNSGYGLNAFYRTSSGSKTTYKNTKALKKGTRYYFKIRGARLIDGVKVCTNWSNKTWRVAK